MAGRWQLAASRCQPLAINWSGSSGKSTVFSVLSSNSDSRCQVPDSRFQIPDINHFDGFVGIWKLESGIASSRWLTCRMPHFDK